MNYDIHSTNSKNRFLSGFIPEVFKMLVVLQSNSSKTNVVMRIVKCNLVYYDNLYLYSNNHQQDKITELKREFDWVSLTSP